MTTQREVVDAFVDGDTEPRRASNLKIAAPSDDSRMYLIGGGDAVYAKREPINRLVVYRGWRHAPWRKADATRMTSRGLRRQARRILRMLPNDAEVVERESRDEDRITPLTSEVDALQ